MGAELQSIPERVGGMVLPQLISVLPQLNLVLPQLILVLPQLIRWVGGEVENKAKLSSI